MFHVKPSWKYFITTGVHNLSKCGRRIKIKIKKTEQLFGLLRSQWLFGYL